MGLQAGTEIFKIKALSEISMAAGLLLNLLWIVILSKLWWAYPYDWFKYFKKLDGKNYIDFDGQEWDADVALSTEMWIFIEIANVCGLKVTNMLFLVFRSCTRTKMTLDGDKEEHLPNTETVKALKPVINSFNANWVPLVVALTVKTDRIIWVMESIYFTTWANALFSTVLIFVHWQKGPAWWTKISPYLYYCMTMFIYVIAPIYMSILLGVLLVALQAGKLYDSVYYVYFLCVNLFRLSEYFTKVKPVIAEILLTMKLRPELESLTESELKRDLDTIYLEQKENPTTENRIKIQLMNILMQERVPYLEQPKPYGSGEARIGTFMHLEKDIFSLTYCVLINDKFIHEEMDVLRGKKWEDSERRDFILRLADRETYLADPSQPLTAALITNIQDEDSQPMRLAETVSSDRERRKLFETLNLKRQTIRIHAYLCLLFQLILSFMVFYELCTKPSYYCPFFTTMKGAEWFVGFICITMLHLQIIDTASRYLRMGKFAINHDYLFHNPGEAFFLCILVFVVTQAIESCNILLCLMTTDTVNMISNFVAIQIVSVFEDFVYFSMSEEPMKLILNLQVYEKVFVIRHTSSKKCQADELCPPNLDPEGEQRLMKVSFAGRKPIIKLYRAIYLMMRTYFVAIYFYFLPSLAVIVAMLIPELINNEYCWTCKSDPTLEQCQV